MAENAAESTVLVTGGAGFIGCAISNSVSTMSGRWVAIDNLHPQVHPSKNRPDALNDRVELIVADITESATWDDLLADVRPDVIVHLAAETGTAQSLDESSRHAEVNVLGTTRMLDALGRVGQVPDRIILSSSRSVYGEGLWMRADGTIFQPGQRSHAQLAAGLWDFPDATPLPSSALTTMPAPTSIYGATKLAQEHLLSAWSSSRDCDLTVLRLQNVYGPGQSLTNPYTGIVSLFSQLAEEKGSIPIYEDGQVVRDFVYIDDVVAAFVAAIPGGHGVGPYDIGSGTPTTLLSLASTIAEFHGAPAPTVTGAFRDGDVRYAVATLENSTAGLGWTPKWHLADGIAQLQKWIGSQPLRIEPHG
jgi:dTDP-L-rhamnose 4-epimerase